MAVKIRLRREGKRKQPFYRVVVADVRSPRDGRFIDDLGYYQPLRDPSAISIDSERALYWLRNGAQPSDAVRNLLRIEGIWEEFKPGDPGRQRSSAQQARAAAQADAHRAEDAEAQATRAPGQDTTPDQAAGGDAASAETAAEGSATPRTPEQDEAVEPGDAAGGPADQPTAVEQGAAVEAAGDERPRDGGPAEGPGEEGEGTTS